MSDVPTPAVAPPFTGWLFGIPPIVRPGDDGRLILSQSPRHRILVYVQMILMVALVAILALELPWKFSTFSGVIILLIAMSMYSELRSVWSVDFDNRQRQMTVAYLSRLFRRRRHRSLADLRAIQSLTFRLPSATHVRLVFGQSDPRTMMVTGFRKRSAAIEFARQLSAHLSVPVEEVDYPGNKPKNLLLGYGCLIVLIILLGEAVGMYFFG